MTWKKYYTVEIGGSETDRRLALFMEDVETLANQYKDISIWIVGDFYKEAKNEP